MSTLFIQHQNIQGIETEWYFACSDFSVERGKAEKNYKKVDVYFRI